MLHDAPHPTPPHLHSAHCTHISTMHALTLTSPQSHPHPHTSPQCTPLPSHLHSAHPHPHISTMHTLTPHPYTVHTLTAPPTQCTPSQPHLHSAHPHSPTYTVHTLTAPPTQCTPSQPQGDNLLLLYLNLRTDSPACPAPNVACPTPGSPGGPLSGVQQAQCAPFSAGDVQYTSSVEGCFHH